MCQPPTTNFRFPGGGGRPWVEGDQGIWGGGEGVRMGGRRKRDLFLFTFDSFFSRVAVSISSMSFA